MSAPASQTLTVCAGVGVALAGPPAAFSKMLSPRDRVCQQTQLRSQLPVWLTPSGLCSATTTPPSTSSQIKRAWRHQTPGAWLGWRTAPPCPWQGEPQSSNAGSRDVLGTPEAFPSTSQAPSRGSFYSAAVGASLYWGLAASL